MREPVRAYLMAGLSTVAVGAIIAAPMSPLSPHIASPQPQVRTNDVQLAAAIDPADTEDVCRPARSGTRARRGVPRIGVHQGGQCRIQPRAPAVGLRGARCGAAKHRCGDRARPGHNREPGHR